MIRKILGLCLLFVIFLNTNAQMSIEKVEVSFMRYVKWPNQESMKTIKIGVYDKNSSILNELNSKINGKNIGLASIQVVEVESIEEIKKCQIIFIPNGKVGKFKKNISNINQYSIMTVTEEQDHTPSFSIINFRVFDGKLTFQLNNKIATDRKIIISNKLAQMARN